MNDVKNKKVKIAFLLTIYGCASSANRFISQVLQYEGSSVFVHIDKKSSIKKEQLTCSPRVFIYENPIQVYWGDYSQIAVVKLMMKYANKQDKYDFYSVHSESDMLVRPINELIQFLAKDNAYAYLWCKKLPYEKWQFGGGLGRIALSWPRKFRTKHEWNSPYRYLRSIYGRLYCLHILKEKKLPTELEFWGLCDWFTLSGACVDDILEYTNNHQDYDRIYKDSLIGSEIYYTTLACNLGKHKKVITDNCLRYIDFEKVDYRKPGSPKVIGYEDINRIEESNYFFARKFDENYDKDVIDYFLKKTQKQDIIGMN